MLSSTLSRRSWMRPWFILNPANCPSVIAFATPWQSTKAQTAGRAYLRADVQPTPKLALSLLVVTQINYPPDKLQLLSAILQP